jgi:hypothetical protein
MKHFAVFPSATVEKANAAIAAWRDKGYATLVYLDSPQMRCDADVVAYGAGGAFPGYYRVINGLARLAFKHGADVVTCIGDDMLPPEQGAEWVGADYFKRFFDSLGVYQGCGDPQGMDASGKPAAARICGSPTFGLRWALQAYQGAGPFCDSYRSYYGDEDLFNVAGMLGMLHMEPSVCIFHRHWSFGHMERQDYHERAGANWERDQGIFNSRKASGFPGSGLL